MLSLVRLVIELGFITPFEQAGLCCQSFECALYFFLRSALFVDMWVPKDKYHPDPTAGTYRTKSGSHALNRLHRSLNVLW